MEKNMETTIMGYIGTTIYFEGLPVISFTYSLVAITPHVVGTTFQTVGGWGDVQVGLTLNPKPYCAVNRLVPPECLRVLLAQPGIPPKTARPKFTVCFWPLCNVALCFPCIHTHCMCFVSLSLSLSLSPLSPSLSLSLSLSLSPRLPLCVSLSLSLSLSPCLSVHKKCRDAWDV